MPYDDGGADADDTDSSASVYNDDTDAFRKEDDCDNVIWSRYTASNNFSFSMFQ